MSLGFYSFYDLSRLRVNSNGPRSKDKIPRNHRLRIRPDCFGCFIRKYFLHLVSPSSYQLRVHFYHNTNSIRLSEMCVKSLHFSTYFIDCESTFATSCFSWDKNKSRYPSTSRTYKISP